MPGRTMSSQLFSDECPPPALSLDGAAALWQFQAPVSPAATGLILRTWRDEAERNDDENLK